ncbi:hypothetical protein [Streptomyces radiopugnans]|uniref:hypothetical protein n=1 Tax=Streptomyces radiopugnans TaxID=403935 RepID=UPI003F1959A4
MRAVNLSRRSWSLPRPYSSIAEALARAAKAERSGSRPVSSQSTVVPPNSAIRARSRDVKRRTPFRDFDSLSGVSPTRSAKIAWLTDAAFITLRTRSITFSVTGWP